VRLRWSLIGGGVQFLYYLNYDSSFTLGASSGSAYEPQQDGKTRAWIVCGFDLAYFGHKPASEFIN
jgi:hypothetical protein